MNPLPKKKTAPPPAAKTNPMPTGPVPEPNKVGQFTVSRGAVDNPQRVLLYGPGGVGKTTLASLIPNSVILDIEAGADSLGTPRVSNLETFEQIRACLLAPEIAEFGTLILDSATKIEEMALIHTLATVPHEKGGRVESIEGYGFGKGYQHLYDTFMLLLADMDNVIRRGQNIILVAHSCIADVPNPLGEDFIRYEPQMQSPRSGKASVRNRVVQWSDSVLFLGYDVFAQDGKASGSGSRTIYTSELPTHIAKSRKTNETLPFTSPDDGRIWEKVLKLEGGKNE